jgi:hypothetical protein
LLATAALIALTLAAGFVAIGGIGRNATRPDKPQGIPVLTGTPAPTLPPGVTGAQTIFQQRLDAIPVDASCPLVERETLQPGGTWTMGSIPPAYRGPTVYRVESGSIAVTANGVVQLTRAGGAAATEVRAGTPTTLAVGDRYFTATDVVTQWRNPGAAPAVVLYAGVVTPSMSENGVGATEDNIVDICPIKLPPTLLGANAALLTVRRFTLAPGAAMPNPPGAGLSFLTVERGTLTVVWANVDAPATPAGTRVFAGGGSIQINGASIGYASYFARTLKNTGADPLTLIVLTDAPVATAATPAP